MQSNKLKTNLMLFRITFSISAFLFGADMSLSQ